MIGDPNTVSAHFIDKHANILFVWPNMSHAPGVGHRIQTRQGDTGGPGVYAVEAVTWSGPSSITVIVRKVS